MKPLFTALFCAMMITCQVFAQTVAPKKKPIAPATNYATLLVAYTQKYLPADTSDPAVEMHKFILTWVNGKATPESFFWRGETGWEICKVSKVIPVSRKSEQDDKWYKVMALNMDDLKPGDLIEVVPMQRSTYRAPEEIPQSARNTLYLRTVTSPWMSLPVPAKAMRHLPDIYK